MRDASKSQEAGAARVRPSARRAAVLASLALAALLGVYADVGQYAKGFWGTVPEAGTPWVLMAFLGGRLARRPLCAAPAGAGLILVGLSAYVALVHFAYATSLYNITTDGRASSWGTLAVLFGSASGVVGSWTWGEPERLRQAAWGFAIGVPVAEAAHVLLTPDHPSAVGLALALVLTGAALVLVASRKVSWGGLLVAAAGWAAVGYTASLVVY